MLPHGGGGWCASRRSGAVMTLFTPSKGIPDPTRPSAAKSAQRCAARVLGSQASLGRVSADCHFDRVQRGVTEAACWDCRGGHATHRSNAPSPFIASDQMTAHWPTVLQVSQDGHAFGERRGELSE